MGPAALADSGGEPDRPDLPAVEHRATGHPEQGCAALLEGRAGPRVEAEDREVGDLLPARPAAEEEHRVAAGRRVRRARCRIWRCPKV